MTKISIDQQSRVAEKFTAELAALLNKYNKRLICKPDRGYYIDRVDIQYGYDMTDVVITGTFKSRDSTQVVESFKCSSVGDGLY